MAMLTSALKQIAAGLGMEERHFGLYLALIRLGALPALFLIPFADRLGRRPVFIFSIASMGLCTFASAFARTVEEFVWLQALTRTFFVTGSAVAFVIVTEEFPAAVRGWGLGMLAALGAVGHGFAAGIYSQIDRLPYGWRALYVVGLVPVLFVPWFLRRIPETTRFTDARGAQHFSGLRGAWEPLRALATTYPMRAIGMAVTGYATSVAILPSFQFSSYYVQEKLAWEPGDYAVMLIVGGAIGIIGNIIAGRLGDAFGRKRIGFVLLGLFPLASFAYYHAPSWGVVIAWVGLVFCSMGGRVILRALATELFPTAHRGAASGMFSVLETLGGVTGLLLIYFYRTEDVDDIALAVPIVALVMYVGTFVLLAFPETRLRELEEIA